MPASSQFEDLPYTIVALAPFAPVGDAPGQPRLVAADLSSLDQALEQLAPTVRVSVPKQYCPEAWVTVAPRAMRDFRPERLALTSPWLKELHDARELLAQAKGGDPEQVAGQLPQQFPDLPLDYSVLQQQEQAGSSDASVVDDILAMVATSGSSPAKGHGLQGLLAQVEGLMAGALAAVYDDPGYRACEAAWRGAEMLLKQAQAKEGAGIVLKLAAVAPEASEFPDVLDAMLGELAADLPNLVLVDVELDSAPARIEYSRRLAGFAETLLAPTLAGAGPGFFRLEDWSQLGKIPYINNFLEDPGYAKWRNLRNEAGGRWLSVVLNRVLARPAYGEGLRPRTPFFSEAAPLWLNGAWCVAALTAKSVQQHGWPSRLTDYHSVALTDLPVLDSEDGPMATEMRMGEERIEEFAEAGFVPLVGMVHKDKVLAPRVPSLSGDALAPQLFLNRVLDFLFWCKDNLAASIESGNVAENLQAAFSLFWQRTGHQPPADLQISAGEPDEGSLPLAIGFTPPRDVLPNAARLEFTFSW